MRIFRAAFRLGAMGIILSLGTPLVLGTAWMPLRFRRIRLSAWMVTFMSRRAMRAFGIGFEAPDQVLFARHEGFAFPNHVSYGRALWRLASRRGPVRAQLLPLPVVRPQREDNARQLALQVHEHMAAIIAGTGGLPLDLLPGRDLSPQSSTVET